MTPFDNISALSDPAIVAMMGEFVRHHRLAQNKTQQQLATEAGINRSTLAEFENGKRSNIITLIQLLRALHLLNTLSEFRVHPEISPIQLAELQESYRKRASRSKPAAKRKRSDW